MWMIMKLFSTQSYVHDVVRMMNDVKINQECGSEWTSENQGQDSNTAFAVLEYTVNGSNTDISAKWTDILSMMPDTLKHVTAEGHLEDLHDIIKSFSERNLSQLMVIGHDQSWCIMLNPDKFPDFITKNLQ